MPQFYTVPTAVGEAKIANAIALGGTITITHLAIGDGNGTLPTPDSDRTALVNEVRRAAINTSHVDEDNPNWIVVEQVLPPDVGGWTIREVGIYDEGGDLIAYGNYPETYKPVLSEGSGRTQTIRFVMQVSSTAAITLKVDPSVVLATRQYVDSQRAQHEQDADAHADNQITVSKEIPQAPGETNVAGALAALGAFAADGFQNMAVFDAPGGTNWDVPEVLRNGIRKAHVLVVGGGGGGGKRNTDSGGGGGGGGAAIAILTLQGIDSVPVTIGEGGAGSGTSGISASSGGTSSFGAFCSATGGLGASGQGAGGRGGDGSGGIVNLAGSPGLHAAVTFNSRQPAGSGGASMLSGGAQGTLASGNQVGTSGTKGGGGAGGVLNGNGGNGGDGIVIVRW